MKNIFAFSLGIRYLQVAFTTSKDSKKSPCVLCDTIFDISWFKNLNSYAGY